MRFFKISILTSIVVTTLFSCSSLKKIDNSEATAMTSYADKNYEQAYSQLVGVMDAYKATNSKAPYAVVSAAANSASQLGKADSAVEFYSQALNDSVTVEGVKGYLQNVNQMGDKVKMNTALNKYTDFLNNNGEAEYLLSKKFDQAVSASNDEAIAELFPQLKTTTEIQNQRYLQALEKTGKNKEALAFVNTLITENPSNTEAKEWKAIYYYNKAEGEYQALMADYNKDKNYTAYVYLKRDLKKVTVDYKQAQNIFEDLRNTNPSEDKYMKYLKNIYLR